MDGTIKCSANYVPLSPISFLERAAVVFANKTSVVYGGYKYTWRQTRDRCIHLASALSNLGLSRHDVVAALAPNVPALCELHFGAPMAGVVLCVLNTHFDSKMLAMALKKTKPKVFFIDSELLSVAEESLNLFSNKEEQPLIITITENRTRNQNMVNTRSFSHLVTLILNPFDLLTSVIQLLLISHLETHEVIFDSVVKHKVTHFGGSPALLNMIANARDSVKKPFPWTVQVMTGGSSPPPEIILRLKKLGFKVMTAYGCTEVYGAGTACLWLPEWETLPEEESLRLKAREGLNHFAMEAVDVVDPTTMNSVPHDGQTIGEIVLRGNTIISGYFKDKEATKAAFRDGWFWTRDMGVIDPDGYIHLKDRSQDVIICGGEIVGSTEIEGLIYSHLVVYEAAVVGRPDRALGESVCAFVKLKEGAKAKEKEIIEFCKRKLGNKNMKMVPKTVVFSNLPKTSTEKTQK